MTLLSVEPERPPPQHRNLADGAWLHYEPNFLAPSVADQLLETILESVRWEQRSIVLFGRRVLQPRLIGWAGDLPYKYSGQTLEARALPKSLEALFESVRAHVSIPFNHVLFNRYRDGQDAMGMHSDDEPELGKEPVLASLSLGARRRFVVVARDKRKADAKLTLELGHGSLLTMGGTIQHTYRHGIPRQRAVSGQRINLTFRRLLTIPSS